MEKGKTIKMVLKKKDQELWGGIKAEYKGFQGSETILYDSMIMDTCDYIYNFFQIH